MSSVRCCTSGALLGEFDDLGVDARTPERVLDELCGAEASELRQPHVAVRALANRQLLVEWQALGEGRKAAVNAR